MVDILPSWPPTLKREQIPPPIEKHSLNSSRAYKHDFKSATTGVVEMGGKMSWLSEKEGMGTPIGAVAGTDGRPNVSRGISELDSQASRVAGWGG